MATTKNVAAPVVGKAEPKKTMLGLSASLGNLRTSDYPAEKTAGIKIRGTGAATKGTKARGPMA